MRYEKYEATVSSEILDLEFPEKTECNGVRMSELER